MFYALHVATIKAKRRCTLKKKILCKKMTFFKDRYLYVFVPVPPKLPRVAVGSFNSWISASLEIPFDWKTCWTNNLYIPIFKPDARHREEFSKNTVKQTDECFDWVHFSRSSETTMKDEVARIKKKKKKTLQAMFLREYVFVRGVGRTDNHELKYFRSMRPRIRGTRKRVFNFFNAGDNNDAWRSARSKYATV